MVILGNGNIGIDTQTPNNILQVGDGVRLRTSNSARDYTVIGTKNVDDSTNTRIVCWVESRVDARSASSEL